MKKKELVKKLQDENKSLRGSASRIHQRAIKKIEQQHEMHERQMQITENEIQRLNVIINFLYLKGRE